MTNVLHLTDAIRIDFTLYVLYTLHRFCHEGLEIRRRCLMNVIGFLREMKDKER